MLRSVYLGLARPQYVSVPEGFLTALAARAFKADYKVDPGPLALAMAYESKAAAAGTRTKTLAFHQTMPHGESALKFAEELERAGLEADADQLVLAQAVAAGIAGARPKDGKVRATIPMTASLALGQNLPGLVGSKNPPDLAGILETFFQMGAPAGSDGGPGAADRWVTAIDHRRDVDKVIRAIDIAVTKTFYATAPARAGAVSLSDTTDAFAGTPFAWFYRTWNNLCSTSWVEALPARVWVDWANTVLRLSFAMGYLWEVAWYEVVARSVVGDDAQSPDDLMARVGPLVPWREQTAGVSLRDVASSTKWRVMRSNGIRNRIREWVDTNGPFLDAAAELEAMRADEELSALLTESLSEPSGTNDNLWEAINYSLLAREGTGADADHYGFLRKHGRRYSVPDPGIEWVAAIASLSCPAPGATTDVGHLLKDLRQLGLRPELGDLVIRLEQAGVARGSADADQAVAIEAAF